MFRNKDYFPQDKTMSSDFEHFRWQRLKADWQHAEHLIGMKRNRLFSAVPNETSYSSCKWSFFWHHRNLQPTEHETNRLAHSFRQWF